MAKSATERSREFRERQLQRTKAKLKAAPARPAYLAGSFADFMRGRHLDLYENLDAFGVFINGSSFDEDQQTFQSQVHRDEPLDSLQRATALVEVFTDAASELACAINEYKLAEVQRAIDAAFARAAALPPGNVEALKAEWAEAERLKALQAGLRTPKRHTFPGITTKGE
ncbi:hypothetical protein Snov_2075 [Ancylobacter novellus DSM 506]|uniref:Uncharacterized protein n=1 Tax=Ancylobacter novellus (strain ATCC 8093 / DSM 506 / JCM 20403 / CCM 1077 / IAM 12100 / NBRC 12443 / NCIMB 10456) TaxID=639283 RepID=D7A0B2_ANCN5|nr:hypothetical protein [Ancylobacter novellus]ADH89373.1 hypothetical protein Snov_2075 [Ancylobacter novellus DSM 506]